MSKVNEIRAKTGRLTRNLKGDVDAQKSGRKKCAKLRGISLRKPMCERIETCKEKRKGFLQRKEDGRTHAHRGPMGAQNGLPAGQL